MMEQPFETYVPNMDGRPVSTIKSEKARYYPDYPYERDRRKLRKVYGQPTFHYVQSPRPQKQSKPIIYVDQPVYSEEKKKTGSKKSILALAVLQAIFGIAAIVTQVVLITKYYPFLWPTFFQVKFLDQLGTGIWSGSFLLIASAVGILAAIKQSYCSFLTFLVTSVFSSLMCIPPLCTSILGTLISPQGTVHLGLNIFQIMISLGSASISITASSLVCGRLCCQRQSEPAVLYKASGPLPNYWPRY